MASYTPNYNLKKPAGTDVVDIADLNGNMDIVDTQLNSLNSNVANAIAFQELQFSTATIIPATGEVTNMVMSVAKTGYTPRMVQFVSPWNKGLVCVGASFEGNNVSIGVVNFTSAALNARPKFVVMYTKNSSNIV